MSKGWSDYFKESMDSLGLPVPASLYADATTAFATIKAIQGAMAVGGDVTIAELIGAGTLSEGLAVAGGVLASFYVGALIGAAIYASASVGWDSLPRSLPLPGMPPPTRRVSWPKRRSLPWHPPRQ